MTGPHDIGGKELGPIKFKHHERSSFDRHVDGLQRLLGGGGARIYKIDELRRMIEELSPDDYAYFSYYERWMLAIKRLLIDKDVISEKEIKKKILGFRHNKK